MPNLFLGNEWLAKRPDLLAVYPYHLHLKTFIEIFRRQYKEHRGRAMRRALVILVICGVAHAEPAKDRAGYIAELIDAIRSTDHAALANTRKYIQIVERNKCQAPEMTLRVGCMLEAAAQNCKQLPAGKRE